MDCNTARLLAAFARPSSSELDSADARALADHIDDCPDCRCQFREEHRLEQHLATAMQAVAIPSTFKPNLLTRLANERNAVQIQTIRKLVFRCAAALVLLLLIFLGAYQIFKTPPRPDTVIGVDELTATPRYWVAQGQPAVDLDRVANWFHQRGSSDLRFPPGFAERLKLETLDGATFTPILKNNHLISIPTLILRHGGAQARVFFILAKEADTDEVAALLKEQSESPQSVERWVFVNPDGQSYVGYIAFVIFDYGRYDDFFTTPLR